MARPTLFLLPALGLGPRSWEPVVAALGPTVDVVTLDPAGAADSPTGTLVEAAAWVAARIAEVAPDRWLLAGSGRGGKLAAIVTAWAEAGEHGLIPPAGLVLVAAAPPAPDPHSAEHGEALAARWADGALASPEAERLIDERLAGPVPPEVRDAAVAGLLGTGRLDVLAWLRRGALEDWSDAVGVLRTPAAIVVGAEDAERGPAMQRRLVLPHVPDAPVHEVAGAGSLVLLERPEAVADAIAELVARPADPNVVPAAFARLIASDRVSARTRRVMLARLAEPPAEARVLSDRQRTLLTAVLARVLPQPGTRLDLAARIDADLATGAGDGWRFAELPPDPEAWRRGLDTLAAAAPGFGDLDGPTQDGVLDGLAAGTVGRDGDGLLTGAQMALWFMDVQAAAVRTWLSHPAAQAWIRYDGFADGGDGPRKQGFVTTHAGEWDPWQRDWRDGEELQA